MFHFTLAAILFMLYFLNIHRNVTLLYITQSTAILCNSLNYLKGMDNVITLTLCIHIGIYYMSLSIMQGVMCICMCSNFSAVI